MKWLYYNLKSKKNLCKKKLDIKTWIMTYYISFRFTCALKFCLSHVPFVLFSNEFFIFRYSNYLIY